MKTLLCLSALTWALATSGGASPAPKEQISADAKWMLHLDFDNFRETKLGAFFANEIVAKHLAELKTQLKFDFNKVFQQIHSITAYGSDYKMGPDGNGVALIKADREAQKAVEGLLAAQMLADTNGPVTKLQQDPMALYSVHNELFVGLTPDGYVLVGKSRKQIENAREVLTGKAANLKSSKAFAGLSEVPNSFFFLAVAEGFAENAAVPPQAKILQMADGGRLVIGEKSDQVFLNLAIRGKNSEVTRQIQSVIEGMIALATLGQSENKDLMQLVQSIKVSGSARTVTIALEYPLSEAISKLTDSPFLKNKRSPEAKSDKKLEDDAPAKKDGN